MPPVERQPSPEPESRRYEHAARFPTDQAAYQVYQRLQDLLYRSPQADLSVYRFQLDRQSHTAVLGRTPPASLAGRLDALLALGEPVTLPPEVLEALWTRRRAAARLGPWVERHRRP
jgi:hypothetical protein